MDKLYSGGSKRVELKNIEDCIVKKFMQSGSCFSNKKYHMNTRQN